MINFFDKIKKKYYRHIVLKYLQTQTKYKSIYNRDLVGYLYDDITNFILIDGGHENEYYNKALEFLKNKNINFINFIDVGANIGTSIIQLQNYFENIYAFEPLEKTFSILKLNTENIKKVNLFKIAASDSKTTKKIYYNEGSFSGASINDLSIHAYLYKKNYDMINVNTLNETIQTDTLDNTFKNLNLSNTLIKLDIEGEEYNALKGTQKIIDKYKPIFFIEINKREIKDKTSLAFDFLKKNEYDFYNIEPLFKPKRNFISRLLNTKKLVIKKITELKSEYQLYVCLICIPKNIK